MLRVVEIFAVTQSYTVVFKFLLVFHRTFNIFVLFLKYSTSYNGMPLKSWLGVVQCH